jgi:hypothetical protein
MARGRKVTNAYVVDYVHPVDTTHWVCTVNFNVVRVIGDLPPDVKIAYYTA